MLLGTFLSRVGEGWGWISWVCGGEEWCGIVRRAEHGEEDEDGWAGLRNEGKQGCMPNNDGVTRGQGLVCP